ncbi:MAG: hypothetical protein JW797_20510 [Bradymonadales bacterium]|nr:hypothetical protein [Bradymonadales bacterium]
MDRHRKPFPRSVLLAIAFLTLGLLTACGHEEWTEPGPPLPTSATVGADGGTITHDGVQLTIPAGALASEVEFTVETVEAPELLPAGTEAASKVYSFTPHGQAFALPATIALPYSGDLHGLSVLVLDGPDDTTWDPVAGATFAGGIATFSVEHLSYYVVSGTTGSSAALVATIEIPDGEPNGILVNSAHDLVVFDASDQYDFNRPHLRFFDVTYDEALDRFEFELSEDKVSIAWTTGIPQGWMAYDRYHDLIYVLAVNGRTTDAGINWDQMWVHIVSGHSQVGAFNYNPEGGSPMAAPADFRIAVAGFTLKEAHSEGDNPTRLFVHDIVGGNIEILDLEETGIALASQERYSYRERLEDNCTWPPDAPPWQCHWLGTLGNTLALEWQIETQSSTNLDDHDLLYLTDHNYSGTEVRVLRITQSGSFGVEFLPDVDISLAHDILVNGIEGLTMAGPADLLYVASGLQSFEDGYIAKVDTVSQTPEAIVLPFSDRGDLLIDPSDSSRAFVAAADGFVDNPALFVHELVDGSVAESFQVLETYDGGRVSSMAYDPEYGLLYLIVGEQILVVGI